MRLQLKKLWYALGEKNGYITSYNFSPKINVLGMKY